MTTKINVINCAYSQMRISGLTVDPTPEDVEVALDRLESMMAELFEVRNVDLGYNFELQPDPNSDTMVPLAFKQMMETNLAIRLIPDFNKAVPQALLSQAAQSLSGAVSWSAAQKILQVQYPTRHPRGSGSTRYNRVRRFFNPTIGTSHEAGTNNILIGDIQDYAESFTAYLDTANGETISSYVITADPKLSIVSDSQNASIINYRIKALDNPTYGAFQQVKITATTSTGRVETRVIGFNVSSSDTVGTL